MKIAIIISVVFTVIGLVVTLYAILFSSKEWIFKTGYITAIISAIVMAALGICHNHVIKQNSPKEYPASEYTFKIKVVEFEKQKDTILVIIPKEE